MHYKPEIDGLRAIAVLSVVAYHAVGLPAAGFVGVDVFFVISGYLITALLLQEHARSGRISLRWFYARRVRRIVPALAVVVGATLAAAALVLQTAAEKQHLADSALASLAFAGNVFFQLRTDGYFDGASEEMPLLHLWSLGVEEQFYILWPLLLLAVLRLRPRALPAAVVALGVASFAWSAWLPDAFYPMPARFWELGVGGLIAMAPVRAMTRALPLAGLALLAIAVAVPLPVFPGIGAVPAVAGAALVLLAVHTGSASTAAAGLLRARPMVFVGLISYSLYLWHWPLLALDRATRVEPAPMAHRLLLVCAALVLAWLSYRLVETPFRRGRGGRVIAVALSASFAAGVGAVVARPATDVADVVHRSFAIPPDRYNSFPGAPARLAIWGDSHAISLRPLAWAMAEARGVSAASYVIAGCLPVPGYPTDRRCRDFNDGVVERIAAGGLDTVLLVGRWLPYFAELPDSYLGSLRPVHGPAHAARRHAIEHGLREVASIAAASGTDLVIVLPLPQATAPAPRCAPGQCDLTRHDFDRLSAPAREYLQALDAEFPNVSLIDLTAVFCDATTCPAVREAPVFTDRDHPTSATVAAIVSAWLRRSLQPLASK